MKGKTEFYTCLIEWSEGPTSYVRVFWAWASHLGEALEKMRKVAKGMGIGNPVLAQADPYEFDNLPATAVTEDGGATYVSDTEHSFPTENNFTLPYGVIHSCLEGEHETDEIVTGFEISQNEGGLIELEAVVEESELISVYLDAVAALSDVRVFWVKIHDDWENIGKEEIYVNEELVSQEAIKEFIKKHQLNTLQNGHVTLTTYSNEGQTNLNISDHKMIVAISFEKSVIDRIAEVLGGHRLNMRPELISVQYGFHHWHYRHPEAKGRSALIDLLKKEGFVIWEPRA